MSWLEMKPGKQGEGEPHVAMSSLRRKGRPYAQVSMRLSRSMAQHIGVSEGDRVSVDKGTLADDGWIRLRRSNEGLKVRHHGHEGSVLFRMNGRWFGVKNSNRNVWMKFKLGGHLGPNARRVLVLLPAWARGGEGG